MQRSVTDLFARESYDFSTLFAIRPIRTNFSRKRKRIQRKKKLEKEEEPEIDWFCYETLSLLEKDERPTLRLPLLLVCPCELDPLSRQLQEKLLYDEIAFNNEDDWLFA